MGDSDLVSAKGIYPYSYMTGPEKLAETQLSPIETFYNTLKDESCPLQKYDQMRKIWVHYNMKTIKKILRSLPSFGRCLVGDVFQNLRNSVYEQHYLDPLHVLTIPSLAWASDLKYTT